MLSVVGRRHAAEDLFQETFLAFLRQVERDGARMSAVGVRTALLRIARSRAVDWLRRQERHRRALTARASDPFLRRRQDAGSATLCGDVAADLVERLDRLPPEQREIVVLRAIGELTFREIGALVGVAENTAVSRYRYGLEKLRAALGAAPRTAGE